MVDDDDPRLRITRSTSEMFDWLKKKIANGGGGDNLSDKRNNGVLPEEIESTITEHSRDGAALAELFPLSRISVEIPQKSLGLMEDEATARLNLDGYNIITPKSNRSNTCLYLSQYLQSFRLLLLITALICFVIFVLDPIHRQMECGMALFIIAVLIFMSSVTYYQDIWARKIDHGFQSMIAPSCSVVRNGKNQTISAECLVAGDIVWIRPGMRVPADIRLLHTDSLRIETSWITGDLNPLTFVATPTNLSIPAMQAQNIAFSGCFVTSGSGMGVVIKTGNDTVLGRLVSLASAEKGRKSRLIIDKARFVKCICFASIIIGTAIFLIGIAISHLQNVVNILINGFFIGIVANIPQGLPVMMTTQLLIVSRRLAKKSIFLKRADTAETLGTASVLLVDKSGVLTENTATLTDLWMDGESTARNTGHLQGHPSSGKLPVAAFATPMDRLLTTMTICNQARIESITRLNVDKWRKASNATEMVWSKHAALAGNGHNVSLPELHSSMASYNSIGGVPLEAALMKFADELIDVNELRQEYDIVFEIPFNKQRRWHMVIARNSQDANEKEDTLIWYHMFVKGAPEELITRCFNIATSKRDRAISEDDLEKFKEQYLAYGNHGRSCIGFACLSFQDTAGKSFNMNEAEYPNDGLTFLGMAAILDSPRAELKRAMQTAKEAKIKVHVVTGDHPSTAAAIAKEANMIDDRDSNATVLIGNMVDQLTPHEWDNLLMKDHMVFARISPSQKKQVVEELMRRNQVVAVTGDGVLDAPSLKEANVGIAIEAVGSAFAKEAADIVVNDGNLENILYGVEQGRLLFENLKKAIAYTLSHLLAEITPVLLTFVLGVPQGLNSVQVFAIDLLCEIFPSTSMIFEKHERDIMKKAPRKSKSRLVSRALLLYSYLFAGSIITIGCFIAYLSVYWSHGVSFKDLLYSTDYWKTTSPLMNLTTASGKVTVLNGWRQDLIRRQACGAWQITLVASQALHIWQCRTRRVSVFTHFSFNPYMILGVAISLSLTALFVYVPGVNDLMGTAPPPSFIWIIPLVVGVVLLVLNEIRKFFIRLYPKNSTVRLFKW